MANVVSLPILSPSITSPKPALKTAAVIGAHKATSPVARPPVRLMNDSRRLAGIPLSPHAFRPFLLPPPPRPVSPCPILPRSPSPPPLILSPGSYQPATGFSTSPDAVKRRTDPDSRQKRRLSEMQEERREEKRRWSEDCSRELSSWCEKRRVIIGAQRLETLQDVKATIQQLVACDFEVRELSAPGELVMDAIDKLVFDCNFRAFAAILADPLGTRLADYPEAFEKASDRQLCLYIRQCSRPISQDLVREYSAEYPGDAHHSECLLREMALCNQAMTSLLYAGTTHHTSAVERAEMDSKANLESRLGNYSRLLEAAGGLDAFALVGVEDGVPFGDHNAYRLNRTAQLMEVVLVSILGPTALNSAPGGFYCLWKPAVGLENVTRRLLQAVPPWATSTVPVRGQLLEYVFRDAVAAVPSNTVHISGKPFERAAAMMSSAALGAITLLNEITDEDFYDRTDSTFYSGPCTGPGPMLEQDLYRHLRSLMLRDSLPEELIRWSCFANYWGCTLEHYMPILMSILLLRYLEAHDNLRFLRIQSAEVFELVLDLETPLAKAETLTGFPRDKLLDNSIPLSSMLSALQERRDSSSLLVKTGWKDYANVPFLAWVPGCHGFRQIVSVGCYHVGAVKHQPLLATPRCQLIWSALVLQALSVLLPPAATRAYGTIPPTWGATPQATSNQAVEAIRAVLPSALLPSLESLLDSTGKSAKRLRELSLMSIGRQRDLLFQQQLPEERSLAMSVRRQKGDLGVEKAGSTKKPLLAQACPKRLTPGSGEHQAWIDSLAPGTNISWAAFASGFHALSRDCSTDELKAYYEDRREVGAKVAATVARRKAAGDYVSSPTKKTKSENGFLKPSKANQMYLPANATDEEATAYHKRIAARALASATANKERAALRKIKEQEHVLLGLPPVAKHTRKRVADWTDEDAHLILGQAVVANGEWRITPVRARVLAERFARKPDHIRQVLRTRTKNGVMPEATPDAVNPFEHLRMQPLPEELEPVAENVSQTRCQNNDWTDEHKEHIKSLLKWIDGRWVLNPHDTRDLKKLWAVDGNAIRVVIKAVITKLSPPADLPST